MNPKKCTEPYCEKYKFLATPRCKKIYNTFIGTYSKVGGRGLISVQGVTRLHETRKHGSFYYLFKMGECNRMITVVS